MNDQSRRHTPCADGFVDGTRVRACALVMMMLSTITPVAAQWPGMRSISDAQVPTDEQDLASIGLPHDDAFSRGSATLRGVAISRGGPAVAVGDHGLIVRSEDGGQTWTEVTGPPEFRNRGFRLSAVTWIGDSTSRPGRVVAVGGGFEPITGISRGVVIFSDDAGQSWKLGESLELTRLTNIRVGQDGRVLEVLGDPSEATGIDQCTSVDGGVSWVPDETTAGRARVRATGPSSEGPSSEGPSSEQRRAPELGIRHVAADPGRRFALAVGDHGTIWRRDVIDDQADKTAAWSPVFRRGRHLAVLFVTASATTTPWPLVGRESRESGNRVGVLVDARLSGGTVAAVNFSGHARLECAAEHVGASLADYLLTDEQVDAPEQRLRRHRPAVLVLDEALPDEIARTWIDAANSQTGTDRVSRLVFSSVIDGSDQAGSSGAAADSLGGTATLRPDALLPHAAMLAGDFDLDALMLISPGTPAPRTVRVRQHTFAGNRGAIRGVSLTSGLPISIETQRTGAIDAAAPRRKLQIATARATQTRRLIEVCRGGRPGDIADALDSILPTTADEDRGRLLWAVWSSIQRECDRSTVAVCRHVVLTAMADRAGHDSIRRWAALKSLSIRQSIENRAVSPSWSAPTTAATSPSDTETIANAGGQHLSPFQIQPVGYQTETASPTSVLVPAIGSSRDVRPIGPTRDNWEYHPAVMSVRGVAMARELAPGPDEDANRTRSQPGNPSAGAPLHVPVTGVRPTLDGRFADAAWRSATAWNRGDLRWVASCDEHYLYLGIEVIPGRVAEVEQVKLQIDVDGDQVSTFHWTIAANGRHECSFDGVVPWQPKWHVATRHLGVRQVAVDAAAHVEIAIAWSSLPIAAARVDGQPSMISICGNVAGDWPTSLPTGGDAAQWQSLIPPMPRAR